MTLKTGKNAGMVIALIVALKLSLMYLDNARFFEVLEEKTMDLRFNIRGVVAPGPETVIAAIDATWSWAISEHRARRWIIP